MIMTRHALWKLNPCLFAMISTYSFATYAAENVIVSASRTNHSIADMAQTTWIIDQAAIEQQVQGGKELKEVLAQLIPGMDVSSQGRTNYGMNMRGRAMMVMVDGVRLNSSRSDSRQLDAIDPFNIERIEVISGATSLYGGGSTGGLINLVTKKGQPGTAVEFQTGIQSGFRHHTDHDQNIDAALSGGTERASGRVSFGYQRYGGGFDGKGQPIIIDNTQTGLQYSDKLDIMGTGTLNIDPHQQLQLTTQYYRSQADGDHGLNLGKNFSAVTGAGHAYNANNLDSDRLPGTERHLVSLQYSHDDFWHQQLVAQIYYRDENLSFYPFPTLSQGKVSSIGASSQKTDFYGGKLTLNSKPIHDLSLTWGMDADHESFRADQQFFDLATAAESGGMKLKDAYKVGRYPGYTITNLAPFLQSSYDAGPLTLSGGVRYQYTQNNVNDFVPYTQQQQLATGKITSADSVAGGSTHYNNLLVNAGILGHLTERQQLWLNFSQGFEIPDVAKYYGTGTYDTKNGHAKLLKSVNVNDSTLDGIKVNSWELGWRYNGDNLVTQIASYLSMSNKTITIDKRNMNINLDDDKRRIYGIEGQADYAFGQTAWSSGANFNLIKSETQVKGQWQKLTVDSASPSKVSAWLGWTPGDLSLRVQSTQNFSVSDDSGKKIKGYNLVDLIGSYQLPVGKISFSVDNLLDKNYTTTWGQRAPGLYSPTYGSPDLYTYKGRGRTYGMSYSVLF